MHLYGFIIQVLDKQGLLLIILQSGCVCCRALKYLASPTLQQALAPLKPTVDLFTLRILEAYQAFSNPFVYRNDHVELLAVCSLPFRYTLVDSRLGFHREIAGCQDHADTVVKCVYVFVYRPDIPVGL